MADIDNKEQSELDQDLEDVEEVEEEETGEETKIKARQLTVQMMQNPQILAALQERLDGLVDTPTGYIESLPKFLRMAIWMMMLRRYWLQTLKLVTFYVSA